MKNLIKLGLVLLVVVSMGACKSGGKPETIAKEFLTALNKMDYDKAKTFGTEETGKMVDMIKSISTMGGDEAKLAEAKKKAEKAQIEIIKTEMLGDTAAVCQYKLIGIEGQDPKEDKIDLVKRSGKWLVNWKKEGMGGEPTTQPAADSTKVDTTAVVK
ncbi:MAG: DUF4878 domain-containing protein [Bacteroidetes bacterium]|nr:DUF4878 domain-containing protein [Bacteroidota bacterium]